MVTISRIQSALVRFIDSEIISRLSALEKIVVGGGGGLIASKLPAVLEKYSDNKLISALGIYDREHGEVDVDALYNAVKPYITSDPIPIPIPFLGITLKFTQREIDALYKYIMEA